MGVAGATTIECVVPWTVYDRSECVDLAKLVFKMTSVRQNRTYRTRKTYSVLRATIVIDALKMRCR